MATFTEIYYNGNEYKQIWLNGVKVWEKSGGEIVYPYPDADCVITYRNTSSYWDSGNMTFDIIDSTLPYSINGSKTNKTNISSNSEKQLKLVNLNPFPYVSAVIPINIEQLRIPNLTVLSYLFRGFGSNSEYTYSWSPQYFEFNENPTSMMNMLNSSNLTDEMMNQFMPYFPNTSSVTNMSHMFHGCSSLTSLDLSNFNTSSVTSMSYMFNGCNQLISLNVSSFDTSNVTGMSNMFESCSSLTSLDLSNFDTSKVIDMGYMFHGCSSLTSLDLSNFDTSKVTRMNQMFYNCYRLKTLNLSNFDTRKVGSYSKMFSYVKDCTIYIGENWTLGTSSTLGGGTNLTFILKVTPIESIQLSHDIEDISSVAQELFVITPSILPTNYGRSDLEIIYDSTYMIVNPETNEVKLKDGCQGLTHTVTYRSKSDNSISKSITFTVSQDLEIDIEAIDFTQSTAPTLPDYMTLDGQETYNFSHGTYTSGIYGLVPNNSGKHSTVAYTRYKYVAPKDGVLTFTYRCNSESGFDILTVHVNTSTSQPSYSDSTNQVVKSSGTIYQDTDGTAIINVTSGTTYYIHIQYRKDSSGSNGYDKGCIRKIELI